MPENTSYAEQNKLRMKEITDSIETGIKEMFDSDKYKQYLTTMSRFHRYSVNNTMLIYLQKPNATLVAGFNKWKDQFERNVMKGERGIKIIAPTPYKKKIEQEKLDPDTKLPMLDEDGNAIIEEKTVQIPMYKVVSVFDVSQTDGKPLPTIATDLAGNVQNYDVFMEALKRSAPVPIAFETMQPEMDGYFSTEDQRIAIRKDMSEVQTVSATIHEIAHSKLHNNQKEKEDAAVGNETAAPVKRRDRNTEEVEAESVSFAVCAYYGIATGENSFGYIATWSKDKELPELRASLETINKTASGLITDIDRNYRDIVKERGLDKAELELAAAPELPYDKSAFSDAQWAVMQNGLDAGLDVSLYAKPELSAEQMEYVRDLMEQGYDVTAYYVDSNAVSLVDHAMTAEDIATTKRHVDYNSIPMMLYTREQWSEITKGMAAEIDVRQYTNTLLSAEQMEQLRMGLEKGMDVTAYTDPSISAAEMCAALGNGAPTEYEYKLHANPRSVYDADAAFIQAYEHRDGNVYPGEVIGFGSYADMRPLVTRLNNEHVMPEDAMALLDAVSDATEKHALGYEVWSEPATTENAPLQPDTPSDDVSAYLPDEAPLGGGRIVDIKVETYDESMTPVYPADYHMPDPAVSVESMNAYGYTDGDMLPLSKERALELFERDISVYMLYEGNGAGMAFDAEDIEAHTGMFGVSREEWEEVRESIPPIDPQTQQKQLESRFLESPTDSFAIYQLKHGEETAELRFMNSDYLKKKDLEPERGNYDLVYTSALYRDGSTGSRLNELFERFNRDHPEDFRGHSLSVSDIVALKQDGVVSCHYVDSVGFKELHAFLKTENYLKNAEMAVEDDYGMIDGIVNNGVKQPTVAELEQQAKSGTPISLMDLMEAGRRERQQERQPKTAEKRPSVLAQLRAKPSDPIKSKKAPVKSAEREL